jgi:hypothetical protein
MSEQETVGSAYLGDGVYASYDGFQIWLRTTGDNGQHIALEPRVLIELQLYLKRVFDYD